LVKAKDKQIERMNILVKQGSICAKSTPKVTHKEGYGHHKDNKAIGKGVVNGHDIPLWNKGGYLKAIMDIAHGVTTPTSSQDKQECKHHKRKRWGQFSIQGFKECGGT
jgi:hypothetical protein